MKLVADKSGRNFTSDRHQRAWKMFKARPKTGAGEPAATNKKFCIYHLPFKSYTYSQAWADFLVKQIADDVVWKKLGRFKV